MFILSSSILKHHPPSESIKIIKKKVKVKQDGKSNSAFSLNQNV